MAGKVEPHGFLHQAVGELFKSCRYNLNIDGVASLLYRLYGTFELLSEVKLLHFCHTLLLCVGIDHS